MKKYDLNQIIQLLQKISLRFDCNLKGDEELYGDCGLDSREFIYVIREIELELGHDIDDEDLLEAELITLNDLILFINNVHNKYKSNINAQ